MKLQNLFEIRHDENHADYQNSYPLDKAIEIITHDIHDPNYIGDEVRIIDHEAADAETVDGSWVDHTPTGTGETIQDAVDDFLEKHEKSYDEDYGKGHLRGVLNKIARSTGPDVHVKKDQDGYVIHDTYTGVEIKANDRQQCMDKFMKAISSKYPSKSAKPFVVIACRKIPVRK